MALQRGLLGLTSLVKPLMRHERILGIAPESGRSLGRRQGVAFDPKLMRRDRVLGKPRLP